MASEVDVRTVGEEAAGRREEDWTRRYIMAKTRREKPEGGAGGRSAEEPVRPSELRGKPPFFGLESIGPDARGKKAVPVAAEPRKNTATIECEQGQLLVENYCGPEKLEALEVDEGILMFSRHDPERQKRALVNVASSEGGNVVAATLGKTLVGYIGVHHPSDEERWGKPGYPWLYELGAIEVSRAYRQAGVALSLMHAAWDDPFYDDKVVISTAFVWHWDLEGTGMNKIEYRELFIELAGRFGFMEMATDDPNISMDSANLFLVRLGKATTFSQYQRFASMLFSNEWEAMLRGF